MGKGSVIILLFIVLVQWVFGFFQVMKYDRFLQNIMAARDIICMRKISKK